MSIRETDVDREAMKVLNASPEFKLAKKLSKSWGWCMQCGRTYKARACGPTHALMHHLILRARREA